MQFLIVYGTGQGQTKKIAGRIAEVIRERGHEVHVLDGREVPADLALGTYNAVIVGSSVNSGKFQRYIVEFVKAHLDQLQSIPSAFFSVSLVEASSDPKQRERLTTYLDGFRQETGWLPAREVSFAGAIPDNRLSWLMRLFWRALDRGRNEYTDWDAVIHFANEVDGWYPTDSVTTDETVPTNADRVIV